MSKTSDDAARDLLKFASNRRFATILADPPWQFTNKTGKVVVVVKCNAAGSFAIDALPDGNYGIKYTTMAAYDKDAPDQAVFGGQLLVAKIPDAGVITIYGKN